MPLIHVAVAVIVNARNEVLIARRPEHVHQGGLWEFPGGKLEHGEQVEHALKREINEELGLQIESARPLIQVRHDYTDKSVLLDVWRILQYQGQPVGREGQPVRWMRISELDATMFPVANKPIVLSLQLPEYYMITGHFDDMDDFCERLEQALIRGIKLVQLRIKHVTDETWYGMLVEAAHKLCMSHGARLLLNTSVDRFNRCGGDGLHLTSSSIFDYDRRPVSSDLLLSVSCHSDNELDQARRLGADMVLLSPVKETRSHPGVPGIGWPAFQQMAQTANCPVYALGGMGTEDLVQAVESGAQGIAAISSFWSHEK